MLRFLSRDASNAQRIADLKRKADASALTSKAKRVLSDTKLNAETKSAPVAVLAPAVPIYNPLTSEEAENVVLSFMREEFYTQFSSMEQTQSIVLPSGIVAVMEQLRRDIEIKFGEKQSASKIKFLGRTKKPFLTWKQRADIVYFLLHPVSQMGTLSSRQMFLVFQNQQFELGSMTKRCFPDGSLLLKIYIL